MKVVMLVQVVMLNSLGFTTTLLFGAGTLQQPAALLARFYAGLHHISTLAGPVLDLNCSVTLLQVSTTMQG